ncbi:unnamed protein product [Rhizophagus irregularis]|nr:unnamed protein product [Rhizophagus irregularis]
MQIHTTDDDVNGGAREDDYDLTQQLSSDILQTIEISKIVEIGILAFLYYNISTRWYKDDKLKNNDLVQQAPISLCIESSSDILFKRLMIIDKNMAVYNEGSIDIAISTNSYDELIIGLCQDFFQVSNQLILNNKLICRILQILLFLLGKEDFLAEQKVLWKFKIHMQKKGNLLSNIDNIQPSSEELQPNREKDTRKQCQKCSQRGHNRVTCKLLLVM